MGDRVAVGVPGPMTAIGRWWQRRRRRNRVRGETSPAEVDESAFERVDDRSEQVRQVLRSAGWVEFDDEHDIDGWAVAPGDALPVAVSCTAEADEGHDELLRRYTLALRNAGYRVEADPEDPKQLAVWPPKDSQ